MKDNTLKKKRKLTLPDTLIIMLVLIVIATALTWIVPAGVYDRVKDEATGRMIVDPDSFHYVEQNGQGVGAMLLSISASFVSSGKITGMLFICGATVHLITFTGAINAGLGAAIRKVSGKKRNLMMLVIMLVGMILGLRGGAETLLLYVPIAVSTSIALGFDSITGVACIMIGGALGFATSWMGINYVVASGIAETAMMADVWYRVIILAISLVIVGGFLYWYTLRISKKPELSLQYESDKTLELKLDMNNLEEFTTRRKIILAVFLLSIVAMVAGALMFSWQMAQFTAFYFVLAILVAILAGMDVNTFAKEFVNGAKTMVYAVIMVVFANSVSQIMSDGQILDTVAHAVSDLIMGLPMWLTASAMFLVQCLINFVMPSASGQAAATLPIMVPIGDVIGLNRYVTVLAFQFGDCLTNSVTPTAGFFMAALAMAKIPWQKWLKWYAPLLTTLFLFYCVMLTIAVYIPGFPAL